MARLSAGVIFSLLLLLVTGCGPVQSTVLQDKHLEIYHEIFSEEKPDDVEVVHSFLVNYTPRIGVVTTADFEIELIATNEWIQKTCDKLHLRKADSDFHDYFSSRKERRANEWYVPNDISNYDLYYLYLTSIPYIHMLVDKEQLENNRYRIYLSKH